MTERFQEAAWRHLDSGWLLSAEGRLDDASYHFGLVGETALKAILVKMIGSLPTDYRTHLGPGPNQLQAKLNSGSIVLSLMSSGRFGATSLPLPITGFAGWSIDIRYHDDTVCPIPLAAVSTWEADAITLIQLMDDHHR